MILTNREVDVSLCGMHGARPSFPEEKRGNSHILKNIEERRGNMDILENYGSLGNIELLQGKPEHSHDQENALNSRRRGK